MCGTYTGLLRWNAVLCLLSLPLMAGDSGVATHGDGWIYTRVGNSVDVQTATQPGTMFEGGGTDVDAAYRWMCAKANRGDFLVIRSSGTADYNPYISRLCPGLNSVATLQIVSRTGARDPFVETALLQAEALFIAGGNQADYVNYWQGTPVSASINALAARGVPIGGTSAGNAILGQFAFSALLDTVTSQQALLDPFGPRVTIAEGFLAISPFTRNLIADDHFVTRDRMGRLIVFLARITTPPAAGHAYAVAVSDKTAFLLEPDGRGSVVGAGAVYFLKTPRHARAAQAHVPLTYRNVDIYRIHAGDAFNLRQWKGAGGTKYAISAIHGVLRSTQNGGVIY